MKCEEKQKQKTSTFKNIYLDCFDVVVLKPFAVVLRHYFIQLVFNAMQWFTQSWNVISVFLDLMFVKVYLRISLYIRYVDLCQMSKSVGFSHMHKEKHEKYPVNAVITNKYSRRVNMPNLLLFLSYTALHSYVLWYKG